MKTKILWLAIAFASIASAFGQPVITAQPVDQTNYVGTTATFTVAATGTEPVTYHWQWDRPSTNFTDLLDETNATLTISGVQTNDAANYRAVVTDATGTTNSAAAHLYVKPLPILSVSQSSSGKITLSWQDTNFVLLEGFGGFDCAAWVRVSDVSPVTFPVHNDNGIENGYSGGDRYFRLATVPSALDYADLGACGGLEGCKPCEEFVKSCFLMSPPGEILYRAYAEEAAAIGVDLGSCSLANYQVILLRGTDDGGVWGVP